MLLVLPCLFVCRCLSRHVFTQGTGSVGTLRASLQPKSCSMFVWSVSAIALLQEHKATLKNRRAFSVPARSLEEARCRKADCLRVYRHTAKRWLSPMSNSL